MPSYVYPQRSPGVGVDFTKYNPLNLIIPRAPTTNDIAEVGTIWVEPKDINGNIVNGLWICTNPRTWTALQASGGAGIFSSLTVTPGPISLTGTTSINISGSAVTTIGTGGTGALNLGNATGNTSITGTLRTSAGITATSGNITATAGNIVLSTAASYVSLPGPVNIMSGAGAPASGLAVNVGDMYINTTAASATTRLYIATAASTWTNVTCAG